MKLLRIVCATLCLLVSAGCNGAKQKTGKMEKGKVLVVFFSHAGENYAVGNIKVGNTKIVADYIKAIGADEFEIVADKDYAKPYKELTEIAKKESEDGEFPPFKGEIKNLDEYSTIFVGGPIWWGTYPRVMFTFFKKYNLDGKTIIPFSTHEGSGLGSVVEDLKTLYPKAEIKGAFSIYGHEVRKGKAKVEKWLKGLGY